MVLERRMRCGHAMRHCEFETTVRAPAMKVKGCHFWFSLLGLGVEVPLFAGIVVSFCQFWTTVLTKNGDFLCEQKK